MLTKLVKGGFWKGRTSFRIRSVCTCINAFLHKRRFFGWSYIWSASSVLFLPRGGRL